MGCGRLFWRHDLCLRRMGRGLHSWGSDPLVRNSRMSCVERASITWVMWKSVYWGKSALRGRGQGLA